MAASKEGKVERYLVERVEAEGGFIRKVAWIGRRGCPDRYVSLWLFHGFVEVKPPDRPKLDPHQKREVERMLAAGIPVALVASEAAVDSFISKLKAQRAKEGY